MVSLQVEHGIKVFIQLTRNDGEASPKLPFEYIPLNSGRPFRSFKRLKDNYGLFHRILGLDTPVSGAGEEMLHKKANVNPTDNVAFVNVDNKALIPKQPMISTCQTPAPPAQPPNLNALPSMPVYSRPMSPPGMKSKITPLQQNKPAATLTSLSGNYESLRETPGLMASGSGDATLDDIKHRLTANLDNKRKGMNVAGSSAPLQQQQLYKRENLL